MSAVTKKPRVVAIIQARMGSTRLPGKTIADISGKPLIVRIIDRIKASKTIDKIIIATTLLPEDDVLENLATNNHVACYRGSTDDVLDRFYQTAKKFGADIIVRITADDPFKDPEIVDLCCRYLLEHPTLDYVSNTMKPTYPEGLDIEVFRFRTLEIAWRSAKLSSEHEHVTPFIWKNPGIFHCVNIENDEDLSGYRWTLDYPEDLQFTQAVYEKMDDNGIFHMRDILVLLKKYPFLSKINNKYTRNAGYLKSLETEKIK
jgi:spore coat polysaccharide biosynthesis protein SpsF (cytidylyltransferase family)